MEAVPVTIFSGYLGSGKTTIILNSLKLYRQPHRFALIKNEFGDASVDGTLAAMNSLAVKELVNGCLCCILVGSLNDAIDELIDTIHPERILIEASGNAMPFPIVLELKKNPRVYLDGVVFVVDCQNFDRIKDTSVVAREQAKSVDLIIFNKTGLVDEDKLYRVKEEVYGISPDTAKLDTADGVVEPEILFGIQHTDSLDIPLHQHDHGLETFTFTTDSLLNKVKVDQVIRACSTDKFYRIKGIVRLADGTTQLLNTVFGRTTWSTITATEESRIIFIGREIGSFKAAVTDYLNHASE